MLTALLEAVIEALVRAAGWVGGLVRGVFAGPAADAGLSAADDAASRRRQRRRIKRELAEIAGAGGVEELTRVYRGAARSDLDRELRIEALIQIADAEPPAAEPLLRDVIRGPDDPWVVLAALDIAARHGMTGLLDEVAQATEDQRPMVATAAEIMRKRLEKTRRRSGNIA